MAKTMYIRFQLDGQEEFNSCDLDKSDQQRLLSFLIAGFNAQTIPGGGPFMSSAFLKALRDTLDENVNGPAAPVEDLEQILSNIRTLQEDGWALPGPDEDDPFVGLEESCDRVAEWLRGKRGERRA